MVRKTSSSDSAKLVSEKGAFVLTASEGQDWRQARRCNARPFSNFLNS